MEIIESSAQLEFITPNAYQIIEKAGRTCYKSENKIISNESGEKFCEMLLNSGHLSVFEHCYASFRIICDRGVSHELVRHRIASYSQESTRYINYSKKGMKFIKPFWVNSKKDIDFFEYFCQEVERKYEELLSEGKLPQEARAILPNCIKTEIVMTANFREWIEVLKQRTSHFAHPDMVYIAQQIKTLLNANYPIIFNNQTIE